ncbi:MAG: NAD-dependent epimerase/dehydratase family protein [Anaerolineales bacterium]
MKYFITGATGFVGGEIIRQLVKAGHEVRAVVRDPQKAQWMNELGVKLHKGDVTDKESMREAMTGVDGVFHVAGWYKYAERIKGEAYAINVVGTKNVLELMQELKISKGVYTSTCAVNSDTKGKVVDESYRFTGKHLTQYDRTKAAAHEIAKDFIAKGLPLVIAMPGGIYGPGDTSSMGSGVRSLLQGQIPVIPTQFGVCYEHVEDTARGHLLMMEKGKIGEAYITAGEAHTLVETYKFTCQIAGVKMPAIIPYQMLKFLSVLSVPFAGWMPEYYTPDALRSLAGVTYWGDSSKAKRELGLIQRPFREGWEALVRHEMKLLGM